MKQQIPALRESSDDLQHQMRQDRQSFQRLQALDLLKTGPASTRTPVAELLGGHRDTGGWWVQADYQGGLQELLTRKKAPGKSPPLGPDSQEALTHRLHHSDGFVRSGASVGWGKEEEGSDGGSDALSTLVRSHCTARSKCRARSSTKTKTAPPQFVEQCSDIV